MSSVCRAARKNRGSSFLKDSEYSRVDWERGTFQSCSLFPDHRILDPHARHSPCLVRISSMSEQFLE